MSDFSRPDPAFFAAVLQPDAAADARWRKHEGDSRYERRYRYRPRKRTCPKNHPRTGKGDCLLCKREYRQRTRSPWGPVGWWLKSQQEAKTHCPHGHPYDEENTYVKNGMRNCRSCHRRDERIRMREKRAAAKAK